MDILSLMALEYFTAGSFNALEQSRNREIGSTHLITLFQEYFCNCGQSRTYNADKMNMLQ